LEIIIKRTYFLLQEPYESSLERMPGFIENNTRLLQLGVIIR